MPLIKERFQRANLRTDKTGMKKLLTRLAYEMGVIDDKVVSDKAANERKRRSEAASKGWKRIKAAPEGIKMRKMNTIQAPNATTHSGGPIIQQIHHLPDSQGHLS